ncbi:MAG: hypothetical protein FWJ90_21340 [Actinomadura sp.]
MSPGDGADRRATPEQMKRHGENPQAPRGVTQSNFTAATQVSAAPIPPAGQ